MKLWPRLIVGTHIAITAVCLQGCAAGRADDGSIILGVKAAQMAETAGQFANQAAGFLPPPWNVLASGAIALLGAGGIGTIATRRTNAARDKADAAYDEAAARTHALFTPPPEKWTGVGPDPARTDATA